MRCGRINYHYSYGRIASVATLGILLTSAASTRTLHVRSRRTCHKLSRKHRVPLWAARRGCAGQKVFQTCTEGYSSIGIVSCPNKDPDPPSCAKNTGQHLNNIFRRWGGGGGGGWFAGVEPPAIPQPEMAIMIPNVIQTIQNITHWTHFRCWAN